MKDWLQSFSSKKRVFAAGSAAVTFAILLTSFLTSYSNAFGQANDPITIKVTGDASAKVEPSQVTIVFGLDTEPAQAPSVIAEQQGTFRRVMDAIQSAGGNTSVALGNSYVSAYYDDTQLLSPSSKYSVYATIPITIGVDQLPAVVEEVADAGFSVASVYASYGYYPGFYEGVPVEFEPGFDESSIAEELGNETLAEPEFLVSLNIVIDTELDTLQNAISEYQAKFEKLTSILQNVGIPFDQIQPAEISINPDFDSIGSGASLYESYIQIVVKAGVDDIEAITTAGQEQGAYVENIFLSVPDSQIDELRKELGQQAVENARSRADEIAEPLGMQAAAIRSIEINANSFDYQYGNVATHRGVNLVSSYDNAGVYGTNEVSVSATVEFELQ